jgi:hypothetical protein
MPIKICIKESGDWLKSSGYSLAEEEEIYEETMQDILDNPRWYLDNVEWLATYMVRWKSHGSKTPTMPYRYVKPKGL